MLNEVIEKEDINIENMIYVVRGVQVMFDFDLARVYKCANGTKSINLAVKRHINRFPERFMFQLTEEELHIMDLRFQFETINNKGNMRGKHVKYLPYAFTEQGVAMLASVLRTPIAEEISIKIMDAFVKMRHFIIDNKDVYKSLTNINNTLIEHDEKLDYLFSKFDKSEQFFLENNEYDAYSSFVKIFKLACNELIIIDSYADNTLLDIIRKLKCQVILITKNSDRLSEIELEKYNKEYHNLKVIRNNSFHDRYFIIDKKEIYESGTSINNAGNKILSINKISDDGVKHVLLEFIRESVLKRKIINY